MSTKAKTLQNILQVDDEKKQQELLTELIGELNKRLKSYINEIKKGILDKLKDKIFLINFQKWFQLSIGMLSIQQCFQYAQDNCKSSLLKFIQYIGALDVKKKYIKINQLINRNLSLEKALVFHTFYWKHCQYNLQQNEISKFIAIFIRLSSFIVQNFLKLKHEPTKAYDDRLQEDKILLQKCQGWVAHNVQQFFIKLTTPKSIIPRKIVLLAIGDIAGALIQTNRQNIINRTISEKLLKQVLFGYCQKHYTWNEIHELFMYSMLQKGYNNPIKKIQIPEMYTQTNLIIPGLNSQAYSYIMINFIKNSLDVVGSVDCLIGILGMVVRELVSRPYELKVEGIQLLKRVVQYSPPLQIKNGYEGGYPIQILLFSLYHYENDVYKKIHNWFKFDSNELQINSLLILKEIYIQNLTREKDQYILENLNKLNQINQQIYIILNKYQFQKEKYNNQILLLLLCEKLKTKNYGLANRLANLWKNYNDNDNTIKQKIEKLLT